MPGLVRQGLYACLVLSTALFAAPVLAEDGAAAIETEQKPDRLVMVGLGVRTKPSYPGSGDQSLGPLPVVNVWRSDQPFPVETPDEAKGLKLVGLRKNVAAGVSFAFAPVRKNKDAPPGFAEVGFGVETGLYVEGYVASGLRLRADVRQSIGGHKALTGELSLDYVLRGANDRQMLTIGPRVRYGSAKYNRAFFEVTPAAAAASGLPAYRPEAGVYALGAVAGAYQPLGERWGLFGFAGYDRLQGQAAASPLVSQRGKRDQFSAGLALTHTFRIKR